MTPTNEYHRQLARSIDRWENEGGAPSFGENTSGRQKSYSKISSSIPRLYFQAKGSEIS